MACSRLAAPDHAGGRILPQESQTNEPQRARRRARRAHARPTSAAADAALQAFIDVVTETVASGEPVAISGFAKFARVERAARMGRNPQTGEAIRIKASRRVRVTPLKAFKDAVLTGKRPAKKATAKKTTAKKTTAKKTTAKKATAKRGTGEDDRQEDGGEEDHRQEDDHAEDHASVETHVGRRHASVEHTATTRQERRPAG